jgi:hypothetical protein
MTGGHPQPLSLMELVRQALRELFVVQVCCTCTAELMTVALCGLGCGVASAEPAVLLAFIFARDRSLTSLPLLGPSALLPLPPPNYFFPPASCQPCPFHIRHMATLGLILAQLRTCILRTTLHRNIPLLILQQPSLASTSLPQAPSHAPLAPPPARPKYSLERVSSTGRLFPAGASGYVGSGYVRSIFQFIFLLIFNPLLGYYVIAIILSVITALITIYHHQIVAQLTPAAHTVKRSVIIWISSSSRFFLNPALI